VGGLGASGGGSGQAFGGGLFLQGDQTITLAPASGTVETISGVIADQTGSGGTGANAGAGRLVLDGAGTLDLAAADKFAGGVTIDQGALELSNNAAAGTGAITFTVGAAPTLELDAGVDATNAIVGFAAGDTIDFLGAGAATLAAPAFGGTIDMSSTGGDEAHLKSGALLGATVNGFGSGDSVDFEAVKYAATDRASYAGGVVTITNKAKVAIAAFDVSGTYTAANFALSNDGSGHLLASYAASNASVFGLHSLLHPVLGAETHRGEFDFRHEANAGGWRDALGGWDGSIGHGPGPGG
jgi:autotransporter-associated beta strand protein